MFAYVVGLEGLCIVSSSVVMDIGIVSALISGVLPAILSVRVVPVPIVLWIVCVVPVSPELGLLVCCVCGGSPVEVVGIGPGRAAYHPAVRWCPLVSARTAICSPIGFLNCWPFVVLSITIVSFYGVQSFADAI